MAIGFFYIICAAFTFFSLDEARAQDLECNETDYDEKEAFVGWPFELKCQDALDICEEDYGYYLDADVPLSCTMQYSDRHTAFYNASYINDDGQDFDEEEPAFVIDVAYNTPTHITVRISVEEGVCCVHNVVLKLSYSNHTCVEDLLSTTNVVSWKPAQGKLISMHCEVMYDAKQTGLDFSKYKVTWYFNCQESLPEGVRRSSNTELEVNIDYRKHIGNYSCSVGDGRFIIHHQVCVKPEVPSSPLSIRCPEILHHDEGDVVVIACNVDAAGMISGRWRIHIYPVNGNGALNELASNLSCAFNEEYNKTEAKDDRVSCSLSYTSSPEGKCFYSVPSDDEWKRAENDMLTKIGVSYHIRGIRVEEFSTFRIEIEHGLNLVNDTDETIVKLRTHSDDIAFYIGCSIGGFITTLLVIGLCFWARLEIRYWWRKTSCSPELSDPREFGAYIGYYYVNESGEQAENQKYKRLIMSMKSSLEKIRCPVYDARFSASKFQWDVENIFKVQRMCDRVVIILTPEYIQQDDNYFEIFSNFLHGTFVFIKTPGVDEAIQMLPEDCRSALMIHLKRNYVINWRNKGDKLTRRFLMKLKLAMPKRPAATYKPKDDLTAEGINAEKCHHTGYYRSISSKSDQSSDSLMT